MNSGVSPLRARYPTAFVTGAGKGLGKAFTEMLIAEGVRVWGTARESSRLEEFFHHQGFRPVALNLSDAGGAETAFKQAADDAGGAFDLVVNNAGYGVFSRFAETLFAEWQAQVDAMLTSTIRINHAALRRMLARAPIRGTLVNVTSLAIEFPLPFMSGYNAAKAGLAAFNESLIFETKGSGVTVIDFRPGDYQTSFNQAMSIPASPLTHDPRLARIWQKLEANMRSSPKPERAAQDLKRALLRGRSGVARSGGLFQARVAPLLSRLAPQGWRRAVMARYYGAA